MRRAYSVLDPYPARLALGGDGERRVHVSHVRLVSVGASENVLVVADEGGEAKAYERAQRACWALIHGPALARGQDAESEDEADLPSDGVRLRPNPHGLVSGGLWLWSVGGWGAHGSAEALDLLLGWSGRAPPDWRHQSQFLVRRKEALGEQSVKDLLEESLS